MKTLLPVLMLMACGQPPCPDNADTVACINGMTLAVAAGMPLRHPDSLIEDMDRMVVGAQSLWGRMDMNGWTTTVQGEWLVCQTDQGPYWTSGCTNPAEESVRIANDGVNRSCDVATFLHEYGHMTGVADHSDPRFQQAEALKDQLCPKL
jgi:hypothetical protein